MSSQSGAYAIKFFVFVITVIVFVFVLAISACSSCDVRRRGDKAACRAGDVDKCLSLGQYYEAKADGILGFAMNNGNTATEYYYRACKLSSAHACTMMMHAYNHTESAWTLNRSPNDLADAMIATCAEHEAPTPADSEACKPLWDFMDGDDTATNRAAWGFGNACNAGNKVACYWLAKVRPANDSTPADADVSTD